MLSPTHQDIVRRALSALDEHRVGELIVGIVLSSGALVISSCKVAEHGVGELLLCPAACLGMPVRVTYVVAMGENLLGER